MKPSSVSLLPLLWLVANHATWSQTQPYTQTYILRIQGVPAGTEKVTEERDRDGNLAVASESEVILNDGLEAKRMAFTTRLVLSKRESEPIHYAYRYTSGTSKDWCEVTVKDGIARRTLSREGNTSEVAVLLQPNTVLLDFNVYYQYDYLLRRYDQKAGGRQTFHNFIPVIGGEIPLAVTFLGDSTWETPTGKIDLRGYKVEFAGIGIGTVYTDRQGRLVRLLAPMKDLEVVRADLLPSEPPPEPGPKPPAGREK